MDLGLVARIFHLDQTKIRTYVIEPHVCDAEVAKPEFGLDKKGRTDFKLYSTNSLTEEHRNIRMISPTDGNESDPSMDSDAVEFLLKNVEPEESIVVIDSKGAYSELIARVVVKKRCWM